MSLNPFHCLTDFRRKLIHRLLAPFLSKGGQCGKTKRLLLLAGKPFLFLQELFWKHKFSYRRDPMPVDVRWGIVNTSGVIKVPLIIIRASIVTPTGNRLFKIEDTPHYPWIKALMEGHDDRYARAKYREYTETYWPEKSAEDALATVVALVESFRAHRDTPITIVTLPPALIGYFDIYVQICDGVHRAAIAKALGHEFVQCRLVP